MVPKIHLFLLRALMAGKHSNKNEQSWSALFFLSSSYHHSPKEMEGPWGWLCSPPSEVPQAAISSIHSLSALWLLCSFPPGQRSWSPHLTALKTLRPPHSHPSRPCLPVFPVNLCPAHFLTLLVLLLSLPSHLAPVRWDNLVMPQSCHSSCGTQPLNCTQLLVRSL